MFNITGVNGVTNYQERLGRVYTEDFSHFLVVYSVAGNFISLAEETSVHGDLTKLPFHPDLVKAVLSNSPELATDLINSIAPSYQTDPAIYSDEFNLRVLEIPVGKSFYYEKDGTITVTDEKYFS